MILKLLGIVTVLSQLTHMAYSSNIKILDMEADTFKTKIWSNDDISESNIKESLIFLYNPEEVDKKYCNQKEFNKLYFDITHKIEKEEFLRFANSCQQIYENNENNIKIAVHMLFEKVSEKYYKDFKILKKLESFKKQENQFFRSKSSNEDILNIFINADKNVNVH